MIRKTNLNDCCIPGYSIDGVDVTGCGQSFKNMIIFLKNIDTSTKNIANKVHSNTLKGVDCFHFMAFTPIMDAPHPSWVFGQQKTDLFNVPAHTTKVKDHRILHLAAGTGIQGFGLGILKTFP